MTDKIVILGMNSPVGREALGYRTHGTGSRLLELTGMSEEDYLRKYERRNVLPTRGWSLRMARMRSHKIKKALKGRRVIVLGRSTWEALCLPDVDWMGSARTTFTTWHLIPHPSGRNRFYNSPANREAVRAYLGAMQ